MINEVHCKTAASEHMCKQSTMQTCANKRCHVLQDIPSQPECKAVDLGRMSCGEAQQESH